jgi:hypothetical protein
LTDIAKTAKQLHDSLGESYDEIEVMQLAGELLDLCRATQATPIEAEPVCATLERTSYIAGCKAE